MFGNSKNCRVWLPLLCVVCALISNVARAQEKRYVIVDQDAMGPAGTDCNAILVFMQDPNVEVLGITVVMGEGWRDEEVAHTLILFELVV